ncbi:MAG: DUF2283 domain-containing protein [Elusimicrobiota bacterium]
MKISFDEKADALYIQFQEFNGEVKETIKVQDGFLVDIGVDGKIFGIEILDATSKRLPKESIGKLNIELPVIAAV